MNRQKRNRWLLAIIILGLTNFAAYTFSYWYLGGDAPNGTIEHGEYYLRGHFLRARAGRLSEPVPRAVWLYSYVHSISIWPTVGAVLVSMLILARPHIIATMKADSPVGGHTFVAVCITVVVLLTGASTCYFIVDFIRALHVIGNGGHVP